MIDNDLWEQMSDFNAAMNRSPKFKSVREKIDLARDNCLGLFMEVSELTDSFPWKPWKPGLEQLDRENLKREIVDCFFFLHHIADCFEIGPDELRQKYQSVMENNIKRYAPELTPPVNETIENEILQGEVK